MAQREDLTGLELVEHHAHVAHGAQVGQIVHGQFETPEDLIQRVIAAHDDLDAQKTCASRIHGRAHGGR